MTGTLRLALVCIAALTGCSEETDGGDSAEAYSETLVDIHDDAYANVFCYVPAFGGELHGYLRCKDFIAIATYPNGIDGKVTYEIDISNCTIPILGSGISCSVDLWKVPPSTQE